MGLFAGSAMAADISCDGTKFIVVDKLTAASKAKMVFVSKDQTCGITKGSGTDAATIGAWLWVTYGSFAGHVHAVFGVSNGTKGWLVNKATVAKYVNKDAPTDGAVKVAVVKPGKLLKLVGKSLGDDPLDIFGAGDLTGGSPDVNWEFRVDNGAESNSHCGAFDCSYKLIAADTGAKLVCKASVAATCPASPSGAFLD
jgi:hypothetical protein